MTRQFALTEKHKFSKNLVRNELAILEIIWIHWILEIH